MCNVSKLFSEELEDNLIVTTIFTCPASVQLAHMKRIHVIQTDLPIPFKRLQYSVKTYFALTINTHPKVIIALIGIDIRK